jgi:hypothetical protein
LQSQAASDFLSLLKLKGIGRYDQHLAGVEHFSPPGERISSTHDRRPYQVEIILSAGQVATGSGRCAVENVCGENHGAFLNSQSLFRKDGGWNESRSDGK